MNARFRNLETKKKPKVTKFEPKRKCLKLASIFVRTNYISFKAVKISDTVFNWN